MAVASLHGSHGCRSASVRSAPGPIAPDDGVTSRITCQGPAARPGRRQGDVRAAQRPGSLAGPGPVTGTGMRRDRPWAMADSSKSLTLASARGSITVRSRFDYGSITVRVVTGNSAHVRVISGRPGRQSSPARAGGCSERSVQVVPSITVGHGSVTATLNSGWGRLAYACHCSLLSLSLSAACIATDGGAATRAFHLKHKHRRRRACIKARLAWRADAARRERDAPASRHGALAPVRRDGPGADPPPPCPEATGRSLASGAEAEAGLPRRGPSARCGVAAGALRRTPSRVAG
jgi:hypothetical protein